MGGPNLEVFKVCLSNLYGVANGQFAVYIMFPIGIMYYYGVNENKRFSVPGFWPSKEQSHRIPTDPADLDEELDRLRAIRLEIRRRRLDVDKAELGTIQRPTPDSWISRRGREG
jgi:protein PET100